MRVLIVEDAIDEAELFADLVAHHGHDPIVAASAEAALDSRTSWTLGSRLARPAEFRPRRLFPPGLRDQPGCDLKDEDGGGGRT